MNLFQKKKVEPTQELDHNNGLLVIRDFTNNKIGIALNSKISFNYPISYNNIPIGTIEKKDKDEFMGIDWGNRHFPNKDVFVIFMTHHFPSFNTTNSDNR